MEKQFWLFASICGMGYDVNIVCPTSEVEFKALENNVRLKEASWMLGYRDVDCTDGTFTIINDWEGIRYKVKPEGTRYVRID